MLHVINVTSINIATLQALMLVETCFEFSVLARICNLGAQVWHFNCKM